VLGIHLSPEGSNSSFRNAIARRASIFVPLLMLCLSVRTDSVLRLPPRLERLPRISLWAWERREDLRAASPKEFAVAYLDQTVTIDLAVRQQRRINPVLISAGTARIPVVRIETSQFPVLDDLARRQTVEAILASAGVPGVSALQVDFDATQSQRGFYRGVLTDLRNRMPSSLPLSITALASWCSWDDWIGNLPVDEAVPMMFRMEPDRHRAPAVNSFRIREPLCRSSVGISTGEPWPAIDAHQRIYVFPDTGWRNVTLSQLSRRLP
jgi:hypothetical protein